MAGPGRPRKPIPDDTEPIIAAFVTSLRDLVDNAVGPNPMSVLAEYGPLSRSTLSHALSGQRMPTRQTVSGIIDSIARYKSLSTRQHRKLLGEWAATHEAASRLLNGESVTITLGTGSGKTHSLLASGLMHGEDPVPIHLDLDTLADREWAERREREQMERVSRHAHETSDDRAHAQAQMRRDMLLKLLRTSKDVDDYQQVLDQVLRGTSGQAVSGTTLPDAGDTGPGQVGRRDQQEGRYVLGTVSRSAIGADPTYYEHLVGKDQDSATEADEVSVAEAQAELKRALEVLEDATRGVARARKVLEQATKREQAAIMAKIEELTEEGASAEDWRRAIRMLWADPALPPEGKPGAAE